MQKQTFVRSQKKRESSCNIKPKLGPISKNQINLVRYQTKTLSSIKLRPIKQKLRPTSKKYLIQYQKKSLSDVNKKINRLMTQKRIELYFKTNENLRPISK